MGAVLLSDFKEDFKEEGKDILTACTSAEPLLALKNCQDLLTVKN